MPWSEDALFVRGGINRDPAAVREVIMDAVADGDGPVISVYCAEPEPGESRQHHVARICEMADLRHGKVQVGRVIDLVTSVQDLVQDTTEGQPECHYHATFSDEVALSETEAFIASAGEPEPKPTGGNPT